MNTIAKNKTIGNEVLARGSEIEGAQATNITRPLLKWAGGKTQLLGEIIPKIPKKYGRFIEPFFGGGAVFFAVHPAGGIIADSNPELVNLYRSVADDVEGVMAQLRRYENTEEVFYAARALDVTKLSNIEAAARTIFLNRTCFNGLYRVNKSGQFNVPFGRYKNPKILDEDALKAASELLSKTTIICGDYKTVLQENAQTGDFIFLD
ncbi:MAG: DNA adenine methylase, partial [Rhodanobacter sp.]